MYDELSFLFYSVGLSMDEICDELSLPIEYVYNSLMKGE